MKRTKIRKSEKEINDTFCEILGDDNVSKKKKSQV